MADDNVQRYTGNNHLCGPGLHLAVSNDPLTIIYKGTRWVFEWHYYFGPSRLHGKTLDPLANQPGERSPFWRVVQWWKDQGCRAVDGIAQWEEPPIIEQRFRRVGRNLIADESGSVVMRFWKGYEKWGPIRSVA